MHARVHLLTLLAVLLPGSLMPPRVLAAQVVDSSTAAGAPQGRREDPQATPPASGLLMIATQGTPASLVRVTPVALAPLGDPASQDTVRRRPRAVVYSDSYATRLRIHRAMSWAMLPVFAASYVSGDQLFKDGKDAPAWARNLHPAAATSSAVLFGANAVTGTWNLWEGRHDPNGRTRRILHGALFLTASGGFAYAGSRLANEAEQSGAKRREHRAVNLASMGVATTSWLIMLLGN